MPEPPPVAFVFGATGYTGRAVVARLRERGVDTVAHVRPGSSELDAHRARFEALGARVDTTPWEEGAVAEALARVAPTHVFLLLGTTRARVRREVASGAPARGYEEVDYGLTAMVLRGCARLSPRPRVVYLSSLGVSEAEPRNAYAHARWKCERDLRAGDLPYVIARPSFISGPDRDERRPLERVGAVVAGGVLGLVAAVGARELRDRLAPMDADELARGLVRAAFDPGLRRAVVEAADLRDPG